MTDGVFVGKVLTLCQLHSRELLSQPGVSGTQHWQNVDLGSVGPQIRHFGVDRSKGIKTKKAPPSSNWLMDSNISFKKKIQFIQENKIFGQAAHIISFQLL